MFIDDFIIYANEALPDSFELASEHEEVLRFAVSCPDKTILSILIPLSMFEADVMSMKELITWFCDKVKERHELECLL